MKNKNLAAIIENIESCLVELDIPSTGETVDQDTVQFCTGIIDGNMKLYIDITCHFKNETIGIKVSSSMAFEAKDMLAIYNPLNLLNLIFMDIGHLSVNEVDGSILLQTSVDCSNQKLNRQQMLNTLKRVGWQGLECFGLFKEISKGNCCPLEALDNFFAKLAFRPENEDVTLH